MDFYGYPVSGSEQGKGAPGKLELSKNYYKNKLKLEF